MRFVKSRMETRSTEENKKHFRITDFPSGVEQKYPEQKLQTLSICRPCQLFWSARNIKSVTILSICFRINSEKKSLKWAYLSIKFYYQLRIGSQAWMGYISVRSRAIAGVTIARRETEVLRENTASGSLFQRQMTYDLNWGWSWACAVKVRPLPSWATAQPSKKINISTAE
jgi:hypothetical protein